MSKKIIIACVILAMLIGIGTIHQPRESTDTSVLHQHQASIQDDKTKTGLSKDGVLTSHLPIIVIKTNGAEIPGASRKDLRKLQCEYSVYDNQKDINSSAATPTMSGSLLMSIRGNSSRSFPKKQYSLKLCDENGESVSQALLGMPADSTWALTGSYIDKSQLRNYIIYNISSEFTSNVPRCRLCEVMLTDAQGQTQYEGLYTLMEKPKVTSNRLKLTPYEKKYTQTSFLLQMNTHIENLEINHLVKDTVYPYNFDLEYPDSTEISNNSLEYIQKQIYHIEKMLLDASHTGEWQDVERSLDLQKFVDYYLINEFFQNYDAGRRSTYIYKNLGGKFVVGPIWDFDGAFNNYVNFPIEIDDLKMKRRFYFRYLSEDPKFSKMCVRRYKELRKSFLSDEYLINYIDDSSEYLGTAALRNCDRWYDSDYSVYYDDIEKLKKFVKDRGAFMDEHFESLITVVDWKGAS